MAFDNVDVEQLLELQRQDVRIVDVRTEAEVRNGMIPGAIHIPLHLIPVKISELDPGVRTVIYCQSGGRSAQACGFLAARGWDCLSNLTGGILAWRASGCDTVVPD